MTRSQVTPIYDDPAYRSAEISRLLSLPAGTVKAWAFGQDYVTSEGARRRFHALVVPADRKAGLLSFNNLCELHLLAAIRRHYKVSMPSVRDGLRFVSKHLRLDRPLLSDEFLTNGVHLFVTHAGGVINASRAGQASLDSSFEKELARVERNARGLPIRLFPTTRSPANADQPMTVVVDPKIAFGRPILVNAGVRTDVIQDRFLAGDSPPDMATDYRVDEAEIWEALRFEQRIAA